MTLKMSPAWLFLEFYLDLVTVSLMISSKIIRLSVIISGA